MSEDNVERIRAGIELFNQGRLEAVLRDLLHPDIEFTPGLRQLGVGTLRGKDNLRRFWTEDLPQALDHFQVEPLSFEGIGDVVLVENRYSAKGARSGMVITQTFVTAYTLRDGLVREIRDHVNREEALQAHGLSE